MIKLTPSRSQIIAAHVGVLLLPLLVFWPGLGGPFIFDDFVNLVNNTALRVQWNDPLNAWWAAAWSSPTGWLKRPLAMLSFAVDHATWGLDSSAWKRSNLILHCLNALLTLAVSTRLLLAAGFGERRALFVGGLLALVWAVHPLQVSSVLYLVQRMEVFGYTFTLLALLAYVHARQKLMQGQNGWPWLIPSGIAVLLGVFTKEAVVIAPALIVALELALFRFAAKRERDERWLRRACAMGVILFALGLCYLFLRYANGEAYLARDFTWAERVLTELRVLAMYVRWILVPIPTAYIFYYDHIPVSTGLLSPASTLASGVFLLTLLTSGWWLRGKIPLFTLGISWFFLGHVLTAGPVPLEVAFEHRNYGPSFGLLLAISALLLTGIQKRPTLRTFGVALSGAFIALSLLGTTLRSWEWGDPIRFISNTATRAHQSARAQHNYGTAMILMSDFDADNPMFHIGRNSVIAATKLPGSRPQAEAMLIEAHVRAGLPVEPQWWASLRQYIESRGHDHHAADAVLALVTCRLRTNCLLDDRELQALLAQAAEKTGGRNPDILLAYGDFAYRAMDDRDLAERLYRASVAAATRSPHFRTSLANFLVSIGKPEEAEAELRIADDLDRLGLHLAQRERIQRLIDAARTATPIEADTPTPVRR